jgi:hypothetical protein
VDSIRCSTQVYGLADGCGDFILNPTSDEQVKLNIVLKAITDTQGSTG